jgi:hypothetical protein
VTDKPAVFDADDPGEAYPFATILDPGPDKPGVSASCWRGLKILFAVEIAAVFVIVAAHYIYEYAKGGH